MALRKIAFLALIFAGGLSAAFPTGWARKCKLTIDHTQVPADQSAMPTLITASSLTTNCGEILTTGSPNAAQSDGGDLRITSDAAGSTRLALEIVNWTQNASPGSATAELWVPTSPTHAADASIYIWYSAGGGQTQPAANAAFGSQAVWDANYIAVYHLQTIGGNRAGSTPDSTASGYALFNGGTTNVTTTAGPFTGSGGNAGVFAGDQSYLAVPDAGHGSVPTNVPTGTGTRTLEGWFKMASGHTTGQEFFGWGGNSSDCQRFTAGWFNDGKLTNEGRNCTATFPWTQDFNWHQIVFTLPSGTGPASVLGYLDSVSQTMTVAAGTTFATVNNTIVVSGISGAQGNDGVFGNLDEIRISNIGRSANWITTQYNSMNSPGTFIVAGAPISTTGFVMRHK